MSDILDLSVIIPVLDEGPNLENLLPELRDTLSRLGIRSEILIVAKEAGRPTMEIAARFGAAFFGAARFVAFFATFLAALGAAFLAAGFLATFPALPAAGFLAVLVTFFAAFLAAGFFAVFLAAICVPPVGASHNSLARQQMLQDVYCHAWRSSRKNLAGGRGGWSEDAGTALQALRGECPRSLKVGSAR